MQSKLTLFLLLQILWFSKNAFTQTNGQPFHHCATPEIHAERLANDTSLFILENLFEKKYRKKSNPSPSLKSIYTLPIVIHIVHDNGPENISDAQVMQGIEYLNQAFANEAPYDPSTGVETPFAFCLATRTPDGLPTTGINRIVSEQTDGSQFPQSLHDLISWNTKDYINIWVAKEVCTPSSGCGPAAYAYLPASHGQPFDGIVTEALYFGNNPANSAVLVHEMGHYLGLFHTFESGCQNDDCLANGDRVCDTPPDNSTDQSLPCDLTNNSCDTDANATDPNNPFTTDVDDFTDDYMDYGNLDCYSRFTQGQSDRMEFFLQNVRFSLLESIACLSPCANPFTVNFSTNTTTVEPGTPIVFTNNSLNVNDFEWCINGVSSSTDLHFTHTFSDEGIFEITLKGSNTDTLCLDQSYSLTITVDCPVEASFTAPPSLVFINENVFF